MYKFSTTVGILYYDPTIFMYLSFLIIMPYALTRSLFLVLALGKRMDIRDEDFYFGMKRLEPRASQVVPVEVETEIDVNGEEEELDAYCDIDSVIEDEEEEASSPARASSFSRWSSTDSLLTTCGSAHLDEVQDDLLDLDDLECEEEDDVFATSSDDDDESCDEEDVAVLVKDATCAPATASFKDEEKDEVEQAQAINAVVAEEDDEEEKEEELMELDDLDCDIDEDQEDDGNQIKISREEIRGAEGTAANTDTHNPHTRP